MNSRMQVDSLPAICVRLLLLFSVMIANGFNIQGTYRAVNNNAMVGVLRKVTPRSPIQSHDVRLRAGYTTGNSDADDDEEYQPCLVQSSMSTSLLGRCRNDDVTEVPEDAYALHVGRALDRLRSDYPTILTQNPDFTLYEDDMECIDPARVTLHGLGNYKAAFDVMHAVVRIIYCPARSTLTFRMCYDTARDHIRIHWNAMLQPRDVFFTTGKCTHVDGISVYTLNSETGQINQHRIEKLLYNDRPVTLPNEGVIGLLRRRQEKEGTAVSVPSFIGMSSSTSSAMVEFRPPHNQNENAPSSLFAMEAEQHTDGDASSQHSIDSVDWIALEAKNKSRLKFGLPPLSPDEFVKLQAAVSQLDATMQEQRDANAAEKRLREEQEPNRRSGPSLMDKILGGALTDTCESNFDCERPSVCCDFGFVKKCCVSGSRVQNGGLQYARIPVYGGSDRSQLPPPPSDGNY